MLKQIIIGAGKKGSDPMRQNKFPDGAQFLAERLVSYGKRVPEAAGEIAPHVVIRTIRNSLHMTQAQLARRAGMPQSHLAKIETGKVDLQLGTLRRILRALNCETLVLPKFHKSPQEALQERIKEVARHRVARAAGAMGLGRLRSLIRSEEERLRARPTSKIWEETRRRAQMPVLLVDREDDRETLRFWLEQPVEARIDAMEFLRRQTYLTTGKRALPHFERSFRLRDRQ